MLLKSILVQLIILNIVLTACLENHNHVSSLCEHSLHYIVRQLLFQLDPRSMKHHIYKNYKCFRFFTNTCKIDEKSFSLLFSI